MLLIPISSALTLFVWIRLYRFAPARLRSASAAAASILVLGLVDWFLLASLPRFGLSFGAVGFGLSGITAARLGVSMIIFISILLTRLLSQVIRPSKSPEISSAPRLQPALLALWLSNAVILALEGYALIIEPFWLTTSHVHVAAPEFIPGRSLRIVQLSDLHVERITRRERQMIEKVNALQPDMIVLTGDYVNLDYLNDPLARSETRAVLSQLSAPYGVYAIAGSVDHSDLLEEILEGLDIHLLTDENLQVQLPTSTLNLMGVKLWRREADAAVLARLAQQTSAQDYTVLLYHTPDLAIEARESGVDLYLAGHTHGGQVRLPFYGAIITMSAYGKQFESGRYDLGAMTLYVSRGLGMEGMGLPRLRFLCPPEIVAIDLGPMEAVTDER